MLKLYERLNFETTPGGVWTQGWNIQIENRDFETGPPLKVIIIPHSHNDPGWILTIEQYFAKFTKNILDNMLSKLQQYPNMTFIWAEISYFSMWWDTLTNIEKKKVKSLVVGKQLEFVTGGWVMNDEASSHWTSIVLQLIEGHHWLKDNLDYEPKNHWSIDPFGLGLTQPLLLKKMGFENMLIQRVHYAVKKQLAMEKSLEFKWAQLTDEDERNEIFTHLMPFYSYDVPHSCGPDPKICCQFDFRRYFDKKMACAWRVPPKVITESNVKERASTLLDQFRKKSTLYRSKVLLVPLGDDFRYDKVREWDEQYNNYQKLFDFINSNKEMNAQVQFGTLEDYFSEVHKSTSLGEFPVLSGDFFTYADRNDHYWSGYYTSRPFYKRMDRILLSYVRAAEIIMSLTRLRFPAKLSESLYEELNRHISISRRALSLFQHHDGITGTSKEHVVTDFGMKLLKAINSSQHVIETCVRHLYSNEVDQTNFVLEDKYNRHNRLPEKEIISVENKRTQICLFNSLSQKRQEVVHFMVDSLYVTVFNWEGVEITTQITPKFDAQDNLLNVFELSFIVEISPLSISCYHFKKTQTPNKKLLSEVDLYNIKNSIQDKIFRITSFPSLQKFTLKFGDEIAYFNQYGLLQSLEISGGNLYESRFDFVKYGTRTKGDKSGAYLFLPDGPAETISYSDKVQVKVVKGPIFSRVIVEMPDILRHIITLYHYNYNNGGAQNPIEIKNFINLSKNSNTEIAMRLNSPIKSHDTFFTDSNGYQMVKRKHFRKLPIQANYYPVSSAIYIEDDSARLTVLTGTSLGGSSLEGGQIEIMLDRRLNQDDNRGLAQGVTDNVLTEHNFNLFLEKRQRNCWDSTSETFSGFLSPNSQVAQERLLNPLVKLIETSGEEEIREPFYLGGFGQDDVNLAILRPNIKVEGKEYFGAILQTVPKDFCFYNQIEDRSRETDKKVNLLKMLGLDEEYSIRKTSLSFLQLGLEIVDPEVVLSPIDVEAFLVYK